MIPNACQEVLAKDRGNKLMTIFIKVHFNQTGKSPIILFSARAAIWNLHAKFCEHKIADLSCDLTFLYIVIAMR
jgi:hypothetical protein